MKWYASQLFAGILGTIVGGSLVFILNELHRLFEQRGHKKRLMAGVRAEIRAQMDFVGSGLTQFGNLRMN